MTKANGSTFRTSRLRRLLMVGACSAAAASAAVAQVGIPATSTAPLKLRTDYFGYSAGVSARVGYTDNINLVRNELAEDEITASSVFSLGAIISKPRVTGIVLGDLDLSYLTEQDNFVVNQDIGLASTFTGVDNWLYLDVSGSTSRQLLGDNARFSRNLNAARQQRGNVHSYSVSPYVYHQMSDQSAVELRYRFSQVFIDDRDADANLFGGDLFNDSRTHEVSASYDTGALLERLRFRTGVYGNETVEDGSAIFGRFEYRQGTVFTEAQFALNRAFSLTGSVGYDEVETEDGAAQFFDEDELSGVYWRGGFRASPGRRTNVRIEYGRRFDDDFIDADIYYELSRRFVFTAGASRTFQTRAQQNNSLFQGVSRQVLEFADRLKEGGELSPRGVVQSANRFANGFADRRQTNGLGTTDSAFANLTGAFERTEVNLSGFYADTDFGFRDNLNYGAALNVNRRLTRRLTAYGDLTWRHTDTTVDAQTCISSPQFFGINPNDPLFDPVTSCAQIVANNGVTDTLIGSIGASMRVYDNVSVFAEFSHSERFSENDILEYTENSAVAGVTLEF
ncbi:MAG: hypothetical protein AAGA09_06390 [Pseudomonadota bacterium]